MLIDVHYAIKDGAINMQFQEFVVHKGVVDIIESFLEIDKGDVCVLFQFFSDVTDIVAGVNVIKAGSIWAEAVLFVNYFVRFF